MSLQKTFIAVDKTQDESIISINVRKINEHEHLVNVLMLIPMGATTSESRAQYVIAGPIVINHSDDGEEIVYVSGALARCKSPIMAPLWVNADKRQDPSILNLEIYPSRAEGTSLLHIEHRGNRGHEWVALKDDYRTTYSLDSTQLNPKVEVVAVSGEIAVKEVPTR